MNIAQPIAAAVTMWLCMAPAWPQTLCQLEDVQLRGTFSDLRPRGELSGAAVHDKYLLAVSNEALGPREDYHAIQVFKRDGDGAYKFVRDEIIYKADDGCAEADFEAMAVSDGKLYVVGSHSFGHKKTKEKDSYKKNRDRLTEFKTEKCAASNTLRVFEIDEDAHLERSRDINLRRLIRGSDLFKAFSALPSKENGIDIEGLAVKGDQLYVGFRGPVLRQNFVPVLRVNLATDDDSEILFVKLGGRGIRDMVSIPDGFLILAGPNGDQGLPFVIYHWDGKDTVPGDGRPSGGIVKELCEMPRKLDPAAGDDPDGNPEGLTVASRSGGVFEVIILYDNNNERLIARPGGIRPG